MAISTNISLNATLLLIKPTITYLVPFKNYILNTDGVYEIYTNKSNVLVEIFNCEG